MTKEPKDFTVVLSEFLLYAAPDGCSPIRVCSRIAVDLGVTSSHSGIPTGPDVEFSTGEGPTRLRIDRDISFSFGRLLNRMRDS